MTQEKTQGLGLGEKYIIQEALSNTERLEALKKSNNDMLSGMKNRAESELTNYAKRLIKEVNSYGDNPNKEITQDEITAKVEQIKSRVQESGASNQDDMGYLLVTFLNKIGDIAERRSAETSQTVSDTNFASVNTQSVQQTKSEPTTPSVTQDQVASVKPVDTTPKTIKPQVETLTPTQPQQNNNPASQPSLADQANSSLDSAGNTVSEWWNSLSSGVKNLAQDTSNGVSGVLDGINKKTPSSSQVGENLQSAGNTIAEGTRNALKSVGDFASGLLNKVNNPGTQEPAPVEDRSVRRGGEVDVQIYNKDGQTTSGKIELGVKIGNHYDELKINGETYSYIEGTEKKGPGKGQGIRSEYKNANGDKIKLEPMWVDGEFKLYTDKKTTTENKNLGENGKTTEIILEGGKKIELIQSNSSTNYDNYSGIKIDGKFYPVIENSISRLRDGGTTYSSYMINGEKYTLYQPSFFSDNKPTLNKSNS